MPRLTAGWKRILRRAWSVRLLVVAGLLSGLEVILPLFAYDLPRGLFAVASLATTGGALAARIIAQKEFVE